jgi:electron transport complex protein RnfD
MVVKSKDESPLQLIVSSSPHLRDNESVSKIMWNVVLALAPAAIFSVFNFGLSALLTITVSILGAVAAEAAIQKWQKVDVTVSDGSAVLSGLLLAMTLPPTIPWYMPLIGSVVAIGIAKHTLGGLGFNVFNPAHVGRAFLLAAWPVSMTAWAVSNLGVHAPDAITAATPLGFLKLNAFDYHALGDHFGSMANLYQSMFFGTRGGSLGETSTLLLLLGGLYLLVRGYIRWQVPVVMIGTVGLLTWIFGGPVDSSKNLIAFFTGDPVFHMMAGGLVIGAFFMATDMVTIPTSRWGQVIFAAGCGILTTLIRLKGGYPEGVCYSILLMNSVTPLIDRYLVPTKFGSPATAKRRPA